MSGWTEDHQREFDRWVEKLGPPVVVRGDLKRSFQRFGMTPEQIRADCDNKRAVWLKEGT